MWFNNFERCFNVFEMLSNDFEFLFNDLSSSLIHFVRSRDPVGEKTTKIGAAAFGRHTYNLGRPYGRRPPL